eukprot:1549672-Amphidinium_carterae.1
MDLRDSKVLRSQRERHKNYVHPKPPRDPVHYRVSFFCYPAFSTTCAVRLCVCASVRLCVCASV